MGRWEGDMILDFEEKRETCFQSSCVGSFNSHGFRHTLEGALANEWFAGRRSFV